LEIAIAREFSEGVRDKGLKLISDNGSQPTAVSFMKDMATLGIEQIFTSYDNPKGNADTERMMRTIKEEVIWIEADYNKLYVHSKLGYRFPEEFKELYLKQIAMEEAA